MIGGQRDLGQASPVVKLSIKNDQNYLIDYAIVLRGYKDATKLDEARGKYKKTAASVEDKIRRILHWKGERDTSTKRFGVLMPSSCRNHHKKDPMI